MAIPILRTSIRVKIVSDDFYPAEDWHLVRFDSARFVSVQ